VTHPMAVLPIRRIFRIVNGSTPLSGDPSFWDGDIAWVTPEDLGKLDQPLIRTTRRTLTDAGYRSCGTTLVPPGSLILTTRAPIGNLAIAGGNLCTNQGCKCLVPRVPLNSKFFYYALHAECDRLQALGQGSTFRELSSDQLAAFEVPIVTVERQDRIAAFLDYKTTAIDALIAKKERQIELLQEKRQALITQVATKGLDPDVPMKESGVEWLGEIPAHWTTAPLKHLASFLNGLAFSPAEWGQEGTPIIRIENLNGGENFNFTTRVVPGMFHVKKGDILFGWSGNRGTSFGPFRWDKEGTFYLNQHIFRVLKFTADRDWLYWCLKAVTAHVEEMAHGIIGMVHITRGALGAIRVPVVPLEEQISIASYLDRQFGHLERLADAHLKSIERLREYRQALISAAVTGKIEIPTEEAV